MNTLKSLTVTIVSSVSLVIGIISSGITNWLDDIVERIFVSEKLCPRCGAIDEHITKNSVLCPHCKLEVQMDEYEGEEEYDESPGGVHPHSPMYR
jgi:hypothetical protein